MTEFDHDVREGATLHQISRAFKVSRQRSVARHNAQLTYKRVKARARKDLRHDASMIGLATVVVMALLEVARFFVW